MLAFTDEAERGLQSGERTAWSRASVAELDNVRADAFASGRALTLSEAIAIGSQTAPMPRM